MEGSYQPRERSTHCSVVVEDQLLVWGGYQPGLPEEHSSAAKKAFTSRVDVFDRRLGAWDQRLTSGDPPLAVVGYSCTSVGRNVIYFGGYCGHKGCYHNSVYILTAVNFAWRELFPTSGSTGPLRKGYCGMVAFHNRLLTVGGVGVSSPQLPAPSFSYQDSGGYTYTNEHFIFNLNGAEWTVPTVSGDVPPPLDAFTFTKISSDQAAMFGGEGLVGDRSCDLRIATLSGDSVHWERVAPHGPNHPMERYDHAAVTHDLDLERPLLVILGGHPNTDSWLCEVRSGTWTKVQLCM